MIAYHKSKNRLNKLLSVFLIIALMGMPLFVQESAALTEEHTFYDSFEDYPAGSVPEGYYSVQTGTGSETAISNTYASEGSQSLRIKDDASDGMALIAKTFEPVDSIVLEFDIYPVRVNNVICINLNSGGVGSANTVFSIRADSQGNLKYYNPQTRVVELDQTLAFNTWSTIRLEVDGAAGGDGKLYVNDELIGTIPKSTSFTTMDRVMFQGAGTPQVGDEFYIDKLKTAQLQQQPVYHDSFEIYDGGSVPEGYISLATGSGAETVISSEHASEGSQSLKIMDDTTDGLALISKEFEPVESIVLEFDIYPVRVSNVICINLNSGGVGSANTVFSIRADSEGNLKYYNRQSGVQELNETLVFNAWSTMRLEVDGGAGKLFVNDELIGTIPKPTNFTSMDRLMFQGAGTNQIGEEFFIDELKITGPVIPEPSSPSVYHDSFEIYNQGTAPDGYVSLTSGNGSETVISSEYASEGSQSLKIRDDATDGLALISKEFEPVESIVLEFDIYPVRSEIVFCINLNSGSVASTNTVFSIRADGQGNLKYYNRQTGVVELNETLAFNVWSTMRLEVDGGAGKLYVNDELIGTIPKPTNFTTMDRLMFQGAGTTQIGEEFYIDELTIIGPDIPEPIGPPSISPSYIEDTFETDVIGKKPDNYVIVSSFDQTAQAVVTDSMASDSTRSLKIFSSSPQTEASIVRNFDRSKSAKIKFDIYPEAINGAYLFDLLSDGNADDRAVIRMKLSPDGSLDFLRNNAWYPITEPNAVSFDQWSTITINAPYLEGNDVTYVDLSIDGSYVGSARYNKTSQSIDRIKFSAQGASEGDVFYVDNVIIDEPDAALLIPEYEERAVTPRVPVVLDSTHGYLLNDDNPETGAIQNWGENISIGTDAIKTSIAVDLGFAQKVNTIRMWDTDDSARAKQEDYAVFYSYDNIEYVPVSGALFNAYIEEGSGRCVHVLEFSGITARYIKINTLYSDMSATFNLANLQEDVQVEKRTSKAYQLPKATGYLNSDTDPKVGALSFVQSDLPDIYLDEIQRSIGLDFGIRTHVEAIELRDSDNNSRLDPLHLSDDLSVYTSDDNLVYTEVENWILSTRTDDGRNVMRISFPSVKAKYIKIHTDLADHNGTFLLRSLQQDVKAYSSVEAASHFEMFDPKRGGEGSFVALKDGSLLMSYNDFVGSSSDFGEAYFSARKSFDGGYTWSEKFTLLPKDEGALNIMMSTLTRMDNGDLGLIYLVKENSAICNVYIRRSGDEGETWSERIRITNEPQGYTIMSSGNRVLRLPSGRIMVPVMYAPQVSDVYGGDNVWAMIWYSDDDGYSWHKSPGWVALPNAALEPTITQLNDGNILMSLRTRSEGKIYKSISTDNGLSWSQPVDAGLKTPSSTNVVHTIPSTGDLMIIWNNVYSSSNGPRNPLTAAISKDNGTTWHLVRNIMEVKSSTGDQAFPVVSFYGRKVIFQFASGKNYATTIRVIDIDTLYHAIDGSLTIEDLPQAEKPQAIYDRETGILSSVTPNMSYSLDRGETWVATGGTSVYFDQENLTARDGIIVKDDGSSEFGLSDVQHINIKKPVHVQKRLNPSYRQGIKLPGLVS